MPGSGADPVGDSETDGSDLHEEGVGIGAVERISAHNHSEEHYAQTPHVCGSSRVGGCCQDLWRNVGWTAVFVLKDVFLSADHAILQALQRQSASVWIRKDEFPQLEISENESGIVALPDHPRDLDKKSLRLSLSYPFSGANIRMELPVVGGHYEPGQAIAALNQFEGRPDTFSLPQQGVLGTHLESRAGRQALHE